MANLIANLATVPFSISDDESFRITIAWAQEKTALLRWKSRWHKPQGTTVYAPEHRIGRLAPRERRDVAASKGFFHTIDEAVAWNLRHRG